MEHFLRINKNDFEFILSNERTFDIRKNDRLYNKGDKLIYVEIDENDFETGRNVVTKITYIETKKLVGLIDDYCAMSFKRCGKQSRSNTSNKPSNISEVLEYASKINKSEQSANNFMNYYQSTGWKMKTGLPIADWKAAFRNWKDYNSSQKSCGSQENSAWIKSLLPLFLQKIAELAVRRSPLIFNEPEIGMICKYYGFERLTKPFNSYDLNDLMKIYESYKKLGSGIKELKGSPFSKKAVTIPTLEEYKNILNKKKTA